MNVENVIAAEFGRMEVLAAEASREIAANRPWWVAAVAFLRKVML
jgi:hypothetical protein